MMQWPIEAAKASGLFDLILVTTDDQEIAEVATDCGASIFMRKEDDGSRGTQLVARQVLMARREFDEACVIYPCSPLLAPSDLTRAFTLLKKPGALYAMSVQTNPLADAGCFYAGDANAWRVNAPLIDSHTIMVPMPAGRVCDINTWDDWRRAEILFDAWRAK